ncbi:MAG: hypothetical protein U9R75_04310 [Candidatus Thermoplasmatota archaeon]|nr:hypothetical protein [Candidatus Thermoplasmatota archaeon]
MTESGKRSCPKCSGEMVCGALIDRGYTSSERQQWKQECKEKSDMYTDLYDVISYKCTGCGYLENYAFKPESDKNEEEGPPVI